VQAKNFTYGKQSGLTVQFTTAELVDAPTILTTGEGRKEWVDESVARTNLPFRVGIGGIPRYAWYYIKCHNYNKRRWKLVHLEIGKRPQCQSSREEGKDMQGKKERRESVGRMEAHRPVQNSERNPNPHA
jgi:hypothetical protein